MRTRYWCASGAASVHPDVWHVMRGRPAVIRLRGGATTAAPPHPGDRPRRRRRGGRPRRRLPSRATRSSARPSAATNGATAGRSPSTPRCRGRGWRRSRPAWSFELAAVVPTSGLIALAGPWSGRAGAGRGSGSSSTARAGGVGLFAVQIAKALGAEVTGVDAAAKLELVRSFGRPRARPRPRGLHARSALRRHRRHPRQPHAGRVPARAHRRGAPTSWSDMTATARPPAAGSAACRAS